VAGDKHMDSEKSNSYADSFRRIELITGVGRRRSGPSCIMRLLSDRGVRVRYGLRRHVSSEDAGIGHGKDVLVSGSEGTVGGHEAGGRTFAFADRAQP
jgi:hypothetical protein